MPSTFNPDLHEERRVNLIKVVQQRLGNVSRDTWALLWVADLDKLERYVSRMDDEDELRFFFLGYDNNAKFASKCDLMGYDNNAKFASKWAQSYRDTSSSSTPLAASPGPSTPGPSSPRIPATQTPPPQHLPPHRRVLRQATNPVSKKPRTGESPVSLSRSSVHRDLSLRRDGHTCVISRRGVTIEAAHIYPFSLMSSKAHVADFWRQLRLFWQPERVELWKREIFEDGNAFESCKNIITLSPDVHSAWQKALFALKPISISADKKRLEMQLFWMPRYHHQGFIDPRQSPELMAGLNAAGDWKLFDYKAEVLIRSGHTIIMETDDPDEKPLPSIHLLDMQWTLQCLTNMSAAAEESDASQSFNDDDEDDLDYENNWNDLSDDSKTDTLASVSSRSPKASQEANLQGQSTASEYYQSR